MPYCFTGHEAISLCFQIFICFFKGYLGEVFYGHVPSCQINDYEDFWMRSYLLTLMGVYMVMEQFLLVDGVLGIRIHSRRMEGVDETTELWRPPLAILIV